MKIDSRLVRSDIMEKGHISEFEYDRHEIERVLFFLSNALQESGNNAKPVLLHSIQVAQMIWERDFSENTVIAAILHDAVEDTGITVADVEREFGQQVARYVESLMIPDYQDVKQSFARAGSDVLAIRAADLIQNSYYYSLASVDIQKELRSKYEYFMQLSDEVLEKSLADELQKNYDQNIKTLPLRPIFKIWGAKRVGSADPSRAILPFVVGKPPEKPFSYF